jgi:hypothetical protein
MFGLLPRDELCHLQFPEKYYNVKKENRLAPRLTPHAVQIAVCLQEKRIKVEMR